MTLGLCFAVFNGILVNTKKKNIDILLAPECIFYLTVLWAYHPESYAKRAQCLNYLLKSTDTLYILASINL